jgi:SAM-dependent methyltransferase
LTYNLISYAAMLADRGRTAAYAGAVAARVGPGSIVLDIGTGPGIMALLACRAGAARVYAADPSDVIQIAREAAEANGFANRITFFQAMTTDIGLPTHVDGVIAEIHGVLPLFQRSLVSILDARDRFLKPGGWIAPARDTIWAAPVSAGEAHQLIGEVWNAEYGLDFSAARSRAPHLWRPLRLRTEDLVAEPLRWAALDYQTLTGPDVSGRIVWSMQRPAVAHGLGLWFDCETDSSHGFSNAPGGDHHVFSQAFFPWPEPVSLSAGDDVEALLRADFDGSDYVWSWQTDVRHDGALKAQFRQSTFLAQSFGHERLARRAHTFVPTLSQVGEIDRAIVELMAARDRSLGEIASTIRERFPSAFDTWEAALTHVADLSDRYSR